jgi:hypothetical protein
MTTTYTHFSDLAKEAQPPDKGTAESAVPPAVRFTPAAYGAHRPGTSYRMDEVPVPLRAFLPSGYPGDGDVPRMIAEQCGANHWGPPLHE